MSKPVLLSGGNGKVLELAGTNDNDVLTWDSATSAWVSAAGGGGGSGTVTSVGLTGGTSGIIIGGAVSPITNAGTYNLDAPQRFAFDTTSPIAPTAAGQISWNATEGSLNTLMVGNNVDAVIGQQLYQRAVNNDTVPLTKGMVVYVDGSSGTRVTVQRATASADLTSATIIGVVAETIAVNAAGFIITEGALKELSVLPATTFTDGDVVYLSPTTAGGLTPTKPTAPQHLVMVGYCVKASNGSAGILLVKTQNGYELGELHDVYINSPTSGQILIYDGATGQTRWENASLAGGTGVTVTPGPGSLSVAIGQAVGTSDSPSFAGLSLTTTPLAVGSGGTGVSSLTSNALLVGGSTVGGLSGSASGQFARWNNTSGAWAATALTGTTNQITVTSNATSTTLSLPQSIATGSSPTFTGLTLSGLSVAGFVKNSAAGVLSGGNAVDLSTADVTNILPRTKGGTGVGVGVFPAINTVFAGASTGSPDYPTFRTLVVEDIPSLSSVYLPLSGGTLTGKLTVPVSGATTGAGLSLGTALGVVPTTPANGDIWTQSNGLAYIRLTGTSQYLLTSAPPTGVGVAPVNNSAATGYQLTFTGGASSFTASTGGAVVISGGNATGTGSTNGGTLTLRGGTGTTNGTVLLGTTQTSAITIGAAGVTTTTINGTLALGTALPLANGGTNASLTAVNGGAVYSTGSALGVTAAGTSGQFLKSSGAGAPSFASIAASDVSSIPYDLPAEVPGTPAISTKVVNVKAVRAFTLASSGHQGGCAVTNPTGSAVSFTVKKNGSSSGVGGTITFNTDGTFSSSITQTSFIAGDLLTVETPSAVNGMDTPYFTLAMTLA